MKTPPAQHRAWAARAALAAARNDQPAMTLLMEQVRAAGRYGFSDLTLALSFELANMFTATDNLDMLVEYVEQVQAEALADKDGNR